MYRTQISVEHFYMQLGTHETIVKAFVAGLSEHILISEDDIPANIMQCIREGQQFFHACTEDYLVFENWEED